MIHPCRVQGEILRFIKLDDGAAEVQVWDAKKKAWRASDVAINELLFAEALSAKELADLGIST